ncbi:MAG TPA: PQQ-dependent sugar dehydrogenase [Ardenticatenaceae bacterium]
MHATAYYGTHLKVAIAIFSLFGALLVALSSPAQASPLGGQFQAVEIVTGLTLPLDIEFLPSGELLIAEKGTGKGPAGQSAIRLARNGIVQEPPAIVLSTNVDVESGIAGMVLDPAFEENGYFYVWYATGQEARDWSGETKLRLSRFTLALSTGKVDPASELIMLDDVDWQDHHNGGGLVFDDGYLYLAIGEIGLYWPAQDVGDLHGKVIRIRPTASGYDIPSSNPFVGTKDARGEVYSLGFRNPYRMTHRASEDMLYLGDVGGSEWEEVNRIAPGANYGWPVREGPCPWNTGAPCDPPSPDSGFTEPALYYPYSELGAAITALAFYEGESFPPEYHDKLFFTDLNSRYIAVGDVDAGDPTAIEIVVPNYGIVADMKYHKENLYTANIYQGQVRMVYHNGTPNQPPAATLKADVEAGMEPLTVTFSAEDVTDPNDVVFDYHWDFGDGSTPVVTRTATITHTYTTSGTYTPTLTVYDVRGAQSPVLQQPITVYRETALPEIVLDNLSRPDGALYRNGETIRYQAVRTGGVDGLDRERPYTWSVELHADGEVITLTEGHVAVSDTLDVDVSAFRESTNVWYRFILTMRAEDGYEVTITRDLHPEVVELAVETWPISTTVTLNGSPRETPFTFDSIVGITHTLAAAQQVPYRGLQLPFEGWYASDHPSNPITTRQWSLVAPHEETTYQARYIYHQLSLPIIARQSTMQEP